MLVTFSLFAAPLIASAGLAQGLPPPAEPSEIVVEGSKDRDRQIRQFVDALTDAPIGGQLSRFNWEVCPAAVGLPEVQNRAITDRLRIVARAAGIRVAKASCKPNALVIVVNDKRTFIEELYRRYPSYFLDKHAKARAPVHEPGPVAAWHVEGVLDSNGIPAPQAMVDGVPQDFHVVESTDSSRLSPPSRPHFVAGIVVVERSALAGITTTQLADYAAMRIYARTDPARLKGSEPTILTVLEAPLDSAVPVTLTQWDLGFLKALYASGERQYATRQRHEIGQRLRRELAGPTPEDSKR